MAESIVVYRAPSVREKRIVGLLIGAVALVYLATLRPGHGWGDDFAQYILHAKNIVEGRAYTDTGYIYNAAYSDVGPKGYPPGLPLVLAPLYAAFGADYRPMKVLMIAAYAGFLAMLWATMRKRLDARAAFCALAVFALNPWNWNFKDAIASEYVFLFWLFWAIGRFQDRAADGGPLDRRMIGRAILTALIAAAAATTRTVGLVFFVGAVFSDWERHRRVRGSTAVMLACGVGCYLVLATIFPGSGSYVDQLEFQFADLWHRSEHYARAFARWFCPEGPLAPAAFLAIALGVLAIGGFVRRLRRGAEITEWVFLGIFLVTFAWPSRQGARFLLPIFAFVVGYAFDALSVIAAWWPRIWETRIINFSGGGLLVCGLLGFASVSPQRIAEDYDTQSWRDAMRYIKSATPDDAVFVFKKPRLLALVAERRTGALKVRGLPSENWAFIDAIHADFVLRKKGDDRESLALREAFPIRLETVFENDLFAIDELTPHRVGTRGK